MKATNKGFFEDFTVSKMPIPDKYKEKPNDFESYIWETQDGKFVRIKDFGDFHLMNTYKLLVNTILFAKEMSRHKALTSQMRRSVTLCNYHLHYLGYELWLRQHHNQTENKYAFKKKEIQQ